MERIVRVYQRSPEPDMLQGVAHCSIDYLTPSVLYFARNWQMIQERTLHTLAGGKERTLHVRSLQAPNNAASFT